MKATASRSASSSTPGSTPASLPVCFPSAVAVPQGDGSYLLKPGRPVLGVQEVTIRQAAKIAGYKSRSSIYECVLNHPLAEKFLRWRYTPGGGKIWIERPSLEAFLAATTKGARK